MNMKKLKIFVEGIADQKFIKDYIQYSFGISLREKIKFRLAHTFCINFIKIFCPKQNSKSIRKAFIYNSPAKKRLTKI